MGILGIGKNKHDATTDEAPKKDKKPVVEAEPGAIPKNGELEVGAEVGSEHLTLEQGHTPSGDPLSFDGFHLLPSVGYKRPFTPEQYRFFGSEALTVQPFWEVSLAAGFSPMKTGTEQWVSGDPTTCPEDQVIMGTTCLAGAGGNYSATTANAGNWTPQLRLGAGTTLFDGAVDFSGGPVLFERRYFKGAAAPHDMYDDEGNPIKNEDGVQGAYAGNQDFQNTVDGSPQGFGVGGYMREELNIYSNSWFRVAGTATQEWTPGRSAYSVTTIDPTSGQESVGIQYEHTSSFAWTAGVSIAFTPDNTSGRTDMIDVGRWIADKVGGAGKRKDKEEAPAAPLPPPAKPAATALPTATARTVGGVDLTTYASMEPAARIAAIQKNETFQAQMAASHITSLNYDASDGSVAVTYDTDDGAQTYTLNNATAVGDGSKAIDNVIIALLGLKAPE